MVGVKLTKTRKRLILELAEIIEEEDRLKDLHKACIHIGNTAPTKANKARIEELRLKIRSQNSLASMCFNQKIMK